MFPKSALRRVTLTLWLPLVACGPELSGREETFDLESAVVGDTYRLFVRLPPGYDDASRRYPLVVQLDANLPWLEEYAVTAKEASRLEAEGVIGPVVVVGIGYPKAADAQRLRSRDFALPMHDETFRARWGAAAPDASAPAFFAFVRDELMPALAKRYRLQGASAALFGHSMGGLFTVYALTRHDEAGLFSHYVAASPSLFWDDAQLFHTFDALQGFATPASLFLTDGSLEGPEMCGFVDGFAERVAAKAPARLTFSSSRYTASHLGTTTPSFRDGLLGFVGVTR